MKNTLLTNPDYDPNRMIDAVIDHMKLRNDAALARLLEVGPPVISKLRNRKIPIGPIHLIIFHEASDISIRALKALAGMKVPS